MRSQQGIVDGPIVYVMPDPEGIGVTVDKALQIHPTAKRVSVCGKRIGGFGETKRWAQALGQYEEVSRNPIVTRSDVRVVLEIKGRTIFVSRVEPWLGIDVTPEEAVIAFEYLRFSLGRITAYPSRSGIRAIESYHQRKGWSFPPCPDWAGEILRSTSGQGRFEVFPAANEPHDSVNYIDATFQYAWCATSEMPVGVPKRIKGKPEDPYAKSWCHASWEPASHSIGLLPYHLDGKRWMWPREGKWSGWISGAELHLAITNGYKVDVEESIVWPESKPVLKSWAESLHNQRQTISRRDGKGAAIISTAIRRMGVAAIGAMHYPSECPAVETRWDGSPDYWGARPEWSTHIWSLARARLAKQMMNAQGTILGCVLDGYYEAGAPHYLKMTKKNFFWDLKKSGSWPGKVKTLEEMYDAGRLMT